MDLTIPQAELARGLRVVQRATAPRSSLPILSHALLEAEAGPGRLTLTATSLELALRIELAADIAADGVVAAPAALLTDYVAQLPTEPVRLTLRSGRADRPGPLAVTCGSSSANIGALAAEDFPTLPPADRSVLEVPAEPLRRALERVRFCAARDDSRPALAGVLIGGGAGRLVLVAADGFRLGKVELGIDGPESPLLLPARAAAELARLLGEAKAEDAVAVTPTADRGGAYLGVGAVTLFARLIEGQFPDYERILPREWRTRVGVGLADLRRAVRAAGLFGEASTRPVRLEAGPDRLGISGRGAELGDVATHLAAAVAGEQDAVDLNARQLGEILEAVPGERADLRLGGRAGPVVIRVAGADGEAAGEDGPTVGDLWVVMPLVFGNGR